MIRPTIRRRRKRQKKVAEPAADPAPSQWPGWRGPGRDGLVSWLPASLPEKPRLVWERKLKAQGLAGVAATDRLVIVVDRELRDTHDAFLALDAETGNERWSLRYAAEGNLDYGNSPRATPLIHDGHAYLLGAFGRLTCVNLDSGEIVWDIDLLDEYKPEEKVVWGVCSSPLIVDGKLIVNPGAPGASLVALDPATGNEIWKTLGDGPGFASFIVATFGGKRQIVGYDKTSLRGWDPATGQRLETRSAPQKRFQCAHPHCRRQSSARGDRE